MDRSDWCNKQGTKVGCVNARPDKKEEAGSYLNCWTVRGGRMMSCMAEETAGAQTSSRALSSKLSAAGNDA